MTKNEKDENIYNVEMKNLPLLDFVKTIIAMVDVASNDDARQGGMYIEAINNYAKEVYRMKEISMLRKRLKEIEGDREATEAASTNSK